MNKVLPVVLLSLLCFLANCKPANVATNKKFTGKKEYTAAELKKLKPLQTMSFPGGWHKAGSHPHSYNMGIDDKGSAAGGPCSAIFSVEEVGHGFGTLMTYLPKAESYRGKRIRLSGYMRTENVKDWAGFWLRVDMPDNSTGEFDNMSNRAVKGTTDWQKYEVVLNVDPSATAIAYGVLMTEVGKVWFDRVSIEIVGDEVASTTLTSGMKKPPVKSQVVR